jgi:acetyl-CoA acetyltransferase
LVNTQIDRAEAALAALDDADLKPDDVDEVFFGNFVGTLSENQGHQGSLMSEAFGSTAPQNVSKARVPQLAWRYATQSAPSGTARPT